MTIQYCKYCQQPYKLGKQKSTCPHDAVPTLCAEHDRMNCGNCEQEKEQGGENGGNSRISNSNSLSHYC